jgi:hypothetical protein
MYQDAYRKVKVACSMQLGTCRDTACALSEYPWIFHPRMLERKKRIKHGELAGRDWRGRAYAS